MTDRGRDAGYLCVYTPRASEPLQYLSGLGSALYTQTKAFLEQTNKAQDRRWFSGKSTAQRCWSVFYLHVSFLFLHNDPKWPFGIRYAADNDGAPCSSASPLFMHA